MYSSLSEYCSFQSTLKENFKDNHVLTAVSCFYTIKNKHNSKYLDWFKHTLAIQCPYVFFGTKESLDIIRPFRREHTTYIECDIHEFETYQYKDTIQSHPVHCPSKELNLIWNEKFFFMEKAQRLNPYQSDYFCWIDAGICIYRDTPPPPISFPSNKLMSLPMKLIVSTSDSEGFDKDKVIRDEYYHYISGTSYLLHTSLFPKVMKRWRELTHYYLSKEDWKYTDQVIMTKMYYEQPDLFHILSEGYGAIVSSLY